MPRPPVLSRVLRHASLLAVAGACTASLALPSVADATTPAWTMTGGTVLTGSSDKNLDTLESKVGIKMRIVRRYYVAGDSVPTARDKELAGQGRMLHISVKAGNFNYNQIANGEADAYFKGVMQGLYALPTKVFFTFQHEADADGAQRDCSNPGVHSICGPEFAKAWNRLRAISRNNGYDNRLFWTPTFTGYGWTPATDVRINHYWPGNANVDVIGADVYDNSCKSDGSKDFSTTSARYVNSWAKTKAPNHPLLVGETGSADDALRDEYINSIKRTLQTAEWSNWRAVEYWNSGEGCDYTIDTTDSIAAFKSMLTTPYFAATKMDRSGSTPTPEPTPDPDPVPSTSAPTVAITSPAAGATVRGTITITGTAKDADGLDGGVNLRIDDDWKGNDAAAPYSFSFDTRKLTNGKHTIELRAWDKKGNMGSKLITVTVSN